MMMVRMLLTVVVMVMIIMAEGLVVTLAVNLQENDPLMSAKEPKSSVRKKIVSMTLKKKSKFTEQVH